MAHLLLGEKLSGVFIIIYVVANISIAMYALSFADYFLALTTAIPRNAVAVGVLTIFFALNVIGIKDSSKVQNILVVVLLIALGSFVVFGLNDVKPGYFDPQNDIFFNDIHGFIMACIFTSYATSGAITIVNVSGECKNPTKDICQLAEKYDAMVMVDDSHGIGVIGEHGKGAVEACEVLGKVDIITGTLGKALGGAAGGFTAAKKEVIELLRNKSRSYLFTNSLSPAVCAAGIAVLDRLSESKELQQKLQENTSYFRASLEEKGFDVLSGIHPIVPVMLYDAHTAKEFSERMIKKGVYVTSLAYPVVPKEKARIRAQVSAVHTREDLDFAVHCFVEVRKELGLACPENKL